MTPRLPVCAVLAAALVTLFPFARPAQADSTLASSGPYTLTQSLVDSDAAYLGWAAGRALTPDEQQRLAALDIARFQRDPAWTIQVLSGEQKNLSFFQNQPAALQNQLRQTVIRDIPDFQANRLTPDEARQMQQIIAGTERPGVPPPTPQTAHPQTPHWNAPRPEADAVAMGGLRVAGAHRPAALTDTRLPVHSGQYTLTRTMVDDDLTVWQLVAGRPLVPDDRRALTAVDVDMFHHAPAWVTANLRQTHKDLPRLHSQNATERANLRQENIVNLYCRWEEQRLTPEEAAQMRAVIGHYVDVVGVDADKKIVVTGQDIDAWVAATRFISAQAHVPGPWAGYRAALVQMARHPSALGDLVETEAGDIERNWAALHLLWPRLTAAQRTQALGKYLAKVKQSSAGGHSLDLESAVALQSSRNVFEQDYLTTTDPRLAQFKIMMQMRMGLFQQHMMEYNTQTMLRNQEDYQRGLRGEGPNPIPIPMPIP